MRHGRVSGRQQPRRGLDERDGVAEPGKRLDQLTADRPAAEYRQPAGQFVQPEDSLVGEVIRGLAMAYMGTLMPRLTSQTLAGQEVKYPMIMPTCMSSQ